MANRTWTNHNEANCMDVYDTITTNFEGKNTHDLSVPCEWAHHKLYKNAWIVGIGPSKQNLWKLMANRTWTNHNQAICMDVNLWYDNDIYFEGKNTFDLSVPCEWAQYKLYKMLELLELDLPNKRYG